MRKNILMKAKELTKSSYLFKPNFVEVHHANMHFIDEGSGRNILFLHGMPSSSYLWRNIVPQLSSIGRCVAVDLIGHGKSDSPDIAFTIQDHLNYLTAFIEKLELKNITIVGHSWGSTLGIAYARQHNKNVEALCYLEPMLGEWERWEDFNPDNPQAQEIFKKFRSEEGWDLIVKENMFLEQIFVNGSMRQLSPEEKDAYIAPFRPAKRRKAAWKAPQELPIAGNPKEVVDLVNGNYRWLKETTIPQLFFYTQPAAFFTSEKAKSFAQEARAVTLHFLGKGVYNHTEDYPYEIGNTLSVWLKNNYSLSSVQPKFSFYTNIHKAIRKLIFETCILAGATNYADRNDIEVFMEKFSSMMTLLREHSVHEASFIHPLLAEKNLPEFKAVENDHEELEEQLHHLEKLLENVLEAEESAEELGNSFYLTFNQFTSHYLQHLQMEESKIMVCLNEHYPMPVLSDVMQRFKISQPPEKAMQSLKLILASVNSNEALFILSGIQKEAPKSIFMEALKMAQQVMPVYHWEKISSQLCIQGKVATNQYHHKSSLFSTDSQIIEKNGSEQHGENIHMKH